MKHCLKENKGKNDIIINEVYVMDKNYTKKQLLAIRLHWLVLFICFFSVFLLSAMKPIFDISPIAGIAVCTFLSGIVSYFMSYTLYEYGKKYGIVAYLLVGIVLCIMFSRYSQG